MKHKSIKLLVTITLLALLFLGLQLVFDTITQQEMADFIAKYGALGPAVAIIVIGLTEIVAPIPGSPAILASLAIFGWEKTLVYSYIGLLIAVVVNFFFSRLLGRKLLQKVYGQAFVEQIDTFATKEGKTALVIGRTLGYPFSDFVSYAAGFTNIKFSTYFVISAVCLAVSHFLFLALFSHLNFDTTQDFVFWIATASLLATSMGLILKKYYKK